MKETIETLTADLQSMQEEREKTRELLHMYNGTIQYLEGKIDELSKPPEKKDKDNQPAEQPANKKKKA